MKWIKAKWRRFRIWWSDLCPEHAKPFNIFLGHSGTKDYERYCNDCPSPFKTKEKA